jgi:hypothetical protein
LRRAPLLAALAALLLAACDWDYYALTNSIPIKGDPSANPVIHVLLGVDGVSAAAVEEARARGAFPGWSFARHVTCFPGTSDYSWTRLLHTQPIDSYELHYYDPAADELVNQGYYGILRHGIPLDPKPCYEAFDFHANGYSHVLYNYEAPRYSLGVTLDNVFTMLEGRVQSRGEDTFLAFVNELDVIGHMGPYSDYFEALLEVDERVEAFKAAHPERTWLFTIVSDHGHSNIPAPEGAAIMMDEELPKVGIASVESLGGRAADGPLVAIPILHSRVSYVALHTLEAQAPEIARRVSTFDFADLVVAKLPLPEGTRELGASWFGIWRGGALLLRFGHAASSDHYFVDREGDLEPLGLGWIGVGAGFAELTDEQLFANTVTKDYPDLLYRVRTSLAAAGARIPAQVLVSFAHPYASLGFRVPGDTGQPTSAASFHGALHHKDTFGVVLTEERELPAFIRADTTLSLFPKFQRRIEQKGLSVPFVDRDEGLGELPCVP